jgi:hypothetical protein
MQVMLGKWLGQGDGRPRVIRQRRGEGTADDGYAEFDKLAHEYSGRLDSNVQLEERGEGHARYQLCLQAVGARRIAWDERYAGEHRHCEPETWYTRGAKAEFLGPTDRKGPRWRATHLTTKFRATVSQGGGEEPKAAAERAARAVLGSGQLVSVSIDGGGWLFVIVPHGLLLVRSK